MKFISGTIRADMILHRLIGVRNRHVYQSVVVGEVCGNEEQLRSM